MKIKITKTYDQSVSLDYNSFKFGTMIQMEKDVPDTITPEQFQAEDLYVSNLARIGTQNDIRRALPRLSIAVGERAEPNDQLTRLIMGLKSDE